MRSPGGRSIDPDRQILCIVHRQAVTTRFASHVRYSFISSLRVVLFTHYHLHTSISSLRIIMSFGSVAKAVALEKLIDHAPKYLPKIGRCPSVENYFSKEYNLSDEEDEEDEEDDGESEESLRRSSGNKRGSRGR